ncbi:MAG: hypothetical protein IT162_22120 [Bryobacterales bacterium]|nr:hypothetical protein [Bryobacterales bacterium]
MSSKSRQRKQRRKTTEAQRAAARANGARSQGPVTPEGTARSAANSTRHGLTAAGRTAATVCIFGETHEEFEELHAALIEEHNPATATEALLVEEMATARWRQQRIWNLESTTIDKHAGRVTPEVMAAYAEQATEPLIIATAVEDLADNSNVLGLYLRYEARLSRQFDRCLQRLHALQDRRLRDLPNEPNPKIEHCAAAAETELAEPLTPASPESAAVRPDPASPASPSPDGLPRAA